jgi:NAD-specific glutamate dehydrogenase
LDTQSDSKKFLDCRSELHQALRETTAWLVDHFGNDVSPEKAIQKFKEPLMTLVANAGTLFQGYEREIYERRFARFAPLGLDRQTCATLALAPAMPMILEMLSMSERTGRDVEITASAFTQVLSELGLTSILERAARLNPEGKWEKELLENAQVEVRASLSALAAKVLNRKDASTAAVSAFLRGQEDYADTKAMVAELKAVPVTPAALDAVARRLRKFSNAAQGSN